MQIVNLVFVDEIVVEMFKLSQTIVAKNLGMLRKAHESKKNSTLLIPNSSQSVKKVVKLISERFKQVYGREN